MLARLIDWSLAHRAIVLVAVALLTVASILSVRTLNLDAIPDLSDTQVIVRTSYMGQAPQIVEDQVTYPITTRMLAVPGARAVRGFSMYGDSFVYIVFEDGTDPYWARSRVLESLSQVGADLPAGVEPQLGPDATGVGWVYKYALVDRTGNTDLAELRSLQDWFLRFELQRLPGVAEVASVGGFVRQYEARIDPRRLQAYGLSFESVLAAVREANRESGGGLIEMAEAEYFVRGVGYIRSLDDLASVPLGPSTDGRPVLLGDVGEVRFGPASRRGIAELDGEGEVVGGIVVMRDGENAQAVIDAVKQRLAAVASGLPPGVEIVTVYDRSSLIQRAVDNLSHRLVEEVLVVLLVCALFLWHVRSSLVIAFFLPLGVLVALAIMRWQGLNANIMSLGGIAIAIGAMVDAAVVMIENAHKRLTDWARERGRPPEGADHWKVIRDSSVEVGPALFFSLLVIALSFLPVFVLEAQEGRMFAPLAWTKTWAMAVAAALSVTLIPVLMGYAIRGRLIDEQDHRLSRWLMHAYRPLLGVGLRHPVWVLVVAGVVLLATLWPASRIGSEFMPELEEGDLLYMPTTLPGLSPGEAQALLQRTNRLIMSVPEVATAFGKAGRADTATDPAPLTMIETVIQLHPQSQWRQGMTMDTLIAELDATVQVPGLTNAWVPPILNRINMQVSGIRTPLGLQVSGPDLERLSSLAGQFATRLQGVEGTRSAFAEQVAGARYIEVVPDRAAMARHGLSMGAVQELLATVVGGDTLTTVIEGRERYPVSVRLPPEWRDSPEALAEIPLVTPSGTHVQLGSIADIRIGDGPPMIRSEDARPATFVFLDLSDPDMGGWIRRAEQVIADIDLPPGYSWNWAGTHVYMERAKARLGVAIPLTLVIVFALFYMAFGRAREAGIVMLTLPLAVIGGVWLLWLLGYAWSVAVAVGFIALAGVAAEFGVIMLIYLDGAVKRARERGELTTIEDLEAALTEGALRRIRPKAMTVITIIAGLLPIMLASGAGAATMQRIAAPMLGGMITAALLSLIVIPAVYRLLLGRELRRTGTVQTATKELA